MSRRRGVGVVVVYPEREIVLGQDYYVEVHMATIDIEDGLEYLLVVAPAGGGEGSSCQHKSNSYQSLEGKGHVL